MESTVSYMSYFMSNTPSDITNEFFVKIPIYELVGSENTMVNEHIDKHIMYYINNHFISNNNIDSYLINHPLYKNACFNKIDEISNMLADRFFEVSEGKSFDMFAPEYENTVISIVYFEASNSYSIGSSQCKYDICNFQSENQGLFCGTYGAINFCQNNRNAVAYQMSCMISNLVSMRDDSVYIISDSNIKNEVKIKIVKITYNGTLAMLHTPSTEIVETIIEIN